MPNWCSTTFFIYGDEVELCKFYMDLTAATSEHPNFDPQDNSWNTHWIGNMFLQAGYIEKEALTDLECRGSIEGFELTEDKTGRKGVLLSEEIAWGPNPTSIRKMIDEKYRGKLDFVYIAEESGMGVYINTDVDGVMFEERWLVEWEDEFGVHSERCTCDEELAWDLSDVLGKSVEEILDMISDDQLDEITELFKEKHEEESEDRWLSLNRFIQHDY